MGADWTSIIQNVCIEFDIPISHLHEIISDPKVMPMIRGYALEYSAIDRLSNILSPLAWHVEKPRMNAQNGTNDVDIIVQHFQSQRTIRIECKLAKKGSFKLQNRIAPNPTAQIKCMRSRTLGESMIPGRARELEVREDYLRGHADNYMCHEFDFVLSSLSNAFFETDESTLNYFWDASPQEQEFLKICGLNGESDPKKISDSYFLMAPAEQISSKSIGLKCPRRKCTQPNGCIFVPNYPIVNFSATTGSPLTPWFRVENVEAEFIKFLDLN
jgi:hypothetical protein